MLNSRLNPFSGVNRRRLLAASIALLAMGAAAACAADPRPATVRLVVDYGDGAQLHLTALPWRDGMTVIDALTAAQTHRHGVAFTHRGSGSSAMVTKIDDVKNEGGGEKSKNWLFYVNDKPAEVGAGVFKLKAGDVVLWKFQVYDYNP